MSKRISRIRAFAFIAATSVLLSLNAVRCVFAATHVCVSGSDETGDGTQSAPFASVERALKDLKSGDDILIHAGEYDGIVLDQRACGTAENPLVIKAFEGEKVLIRPKTADTEDVTGIHIVNASNLIIEGLEVEGGTRGIYYESTRDAGSVPLENITIKNCEVHGIRGTHGICAYARNDLAPVKNLTMTGCLVYDCECGDSEATVFNGNIDGFKITDNVIRDNNNIGIDMIGFEGTAKHPDNSLGENPYARDFVRNGVCCGNTVYNISTLGNSAYLDKGEYDLCAGGIYVDGGQNIEIFNNHVYDCNIGIEVATEHEPSKNELFKVSGIKVHDNVIERCNGWCGLCFGGYDSKKGFTKNCAFTNNTLIDNDTQIVVQRSKNNIVSRNLLAGGETGIEFNEDCKKQDMDNDISDNIAAEIKDRDSWSESYGRLFDDRDRIIREYTPLEEGYGSAFIPLSLSPAPTVSENDIIVVVKRLDISKRFDGHRKLKEFDPDAGHRYTVDDKKLAAINKKGILRPRNKGEINIFFEQKTKEGSWIKLGDPVHLYIQLPVMQKKDSVPLTEATIDAYKYLSQTSLKPTIWQSSNPSVAEIDRQGKITLRRKGSFKVYAVFGTGRESSKKKYKTSIRVY